MSDVLGENAVNYYSKESAKLYELSGAFKRIQESMAIDALSLSDFKKNDLILDLGCGTGFSLNVLIKKGFKAVGIDVSFEMLAHAKNKGLIVACADMKNLPFKDESFDGLISISAIQWEAPENYGLMLDEIRRVIKNSAIIQFYPKEKAEFECFIKLSEKKFEIVEVFSVGEGVKEKKYVRMIKQCKGRKA
ncbi:MAG: class I SAM-dependent methyltransferase [Candidatus Nanoarchaeia archaeon]|nr:class I SAM-dependent methyltransferase [Candidatus Nanoarchaeia archaeon]MDD5054155.1 class I SAM-dependent methyltransferase [Candidatus Nanoarchaeia archaeon]MDD5499538.1 class I SAM-dependent methyltransferase [Candidatus Nanoarchaeia archaeon]